MEKLTAGGERFRVKAGVARVKVGVLRAKADGSTL
jgi:hypothetical protein